jgi:predicted DsbA family dithiol-disulfide isomerase
MEPRLIHGGALRLEDRMTKASLNLDVVSDAVCPWCYIGKRNLDAALAQLTDLQVTVNWRPFQLDPTIPREGISRHEYMARKFGPEKIGEIHTRLEGVGKAVGIDFAFDRIEKSPNTLNAHRLIRWSQSSGKQTQVVEALFNTYFTQGKDIGAQSVLTDIAAGAGLDAREIGAALQTDHDEKDVQEEIATAMRMGVSGVPFFIIAGRYGMSGAQPPDMLADVIRKASTETEA